MMRKAQGMRASPGSAAGPFVRLEHAAFGRSRGAILGRPSAAPSPLAGEGWGEGASPRDAASNRDEPAALRAALGLAARELTRLSAIAGAECLEFQLALLDDDALLAPAWEKLAEGRPADEVWRGVMDDLMRTLTADPSAYVQARGLDVADLRSRVLAALQGEAPAPPPPAGAIVAAEDLPPSRFLEIDWSRGGGIVLSRGGDLSHTAILARAYGVPMLVQTGPLPDAAHALLDADRGFVLLDPPDAALRPPPRARGTPEADLSAPSRYRGEAVRLLLNIEGPESLAHPAAAFADGVGLMRTEYLFLGRREAPDEDAQYEAYRAVLRWAGERPATIRTVDAGGDKPLAGHSEAGEANPALGLRGLRLSLRRPAPFKTQLRALARAAAHGNLKVMLPFVTAPAEFEAARAMLREAVEALTAEGREARLPELGMMVEIPAAALTIPRFDAAFFSIGANDLTQFVLACDRADARGLYDPLHPAVLELIRRVVQDAGGRSVSLCGDVAGDPAHILTLLRCGLREVSMSATALTAVKRALREAPLD